MLTGRSDVLPELGSSKNLLHSGSLSGLSDDEEAGASDQILYTASFKELAAENVQYETIIWVSISLLLVLAWGVGIIMLLYLPIKRYVLQKDISSRKLYVTPHAIVYKVIYLILLLLLTHYLGKVIVLYHYFWMFYCFFFKVSRPSFIPFWGVVSIERHVPLSQVIDVIIEQGTKRKLTPCLLY